MIDVERELRAVLEDDAQSAPPPRGLEPIARRTYRRQLATVAIGLVAVIALAATSIAGATALLRSSERPAEPPDELQLGPLEAVPFGPAYPRDLTVDGKGTLWWTAIGLSRFEAGTGSLRTFTLADDPAFEYVVAIAGARDGGVWIVSEGTVRLFDGATFVQAFGPAPLCGIGEGPDGTLWGTGCAGAGGVYRWDGESWEPLPTEGRPSTGAGALAFEDSGAIWVSNGGRGGVSRFDGTTWTTWTTADGLTHDHVYTIEPTPDGAVWFGTEDGVTRYADGTWTAFPGAETGLPEVTSIVATGKGVWAAGFTGDDRFATRFDGATWHPVTAEDGLDAFAPGDARFVGTPDGVWAVTNAALLRLEGSRWSQRASLGSGPGDQVVYSPIAARSRDELWIGANRDWGLWRLTNGTWTHFPEQDGLPEESVPNSGFWDAFAFTADGTVWVSGYEGVFRFDGSTWERAAPGEHRMITLGPDGTPWAAWPDGARGWAVGPVGGTPIVEPVPLDLVGSLVVVSEDDVWAGSAGGWVEGQGLWHFDGSNWVEVEPIAGARELVVQDMVRTEDGALWLWASFRYQDFVAVGPGAGGWRHTLARFDGETWTTIEEIDGTPLEIRGDWVGGQLELAPNGDLLFATSGVSSDGLFRLRDGRWTRVAGGSFSHISAAPDGTVWLMGDSGLFRLPAS